MAFVFNPERSPIEIIKFGEPTEGFSSRMKCLEPGTHALYFEVRRNLEALFMGPNSQLHWYAIIQLRARRLTAYGETYWLVEAFDVMRQGRTDACLRTDHNSFEGSSNGTLLGTRRTLKQASDFIKTLLGMDWEVADTRLDPELFPPDADALNKAWDEEHDEFIN